MMCSFLFAIKKKNSFDVESSYCGGKNGNKIFIFYFIKFIANNSLGILVESSHSKKKKKKKKFLR